MQAQVSVMVSSSDINILPISRFPGVFFLNNPGMSGKLHALKKLHGEIGNLLQILQKTHCSTTSVYYEEGKNDWEENNVYYLHVDGVQYNPFCRSIRS
jgi:hypothetical protein